eukprot:TRINITY_DN5771_c0_g1_i4.p1 TRINITY_DN5771_c0_g1~~TRINITY_DN5771_c0_g1_i4.p1  ORF type:complete len:135 (+),score=25.89 TRINITY_DN5771_c0_g1_i4:250-654(+)
MKAFVEGADGVMVAACHEGNCKAERGNIYAGWRVAEVQKRLEAMGLNKDRLIFTTVASNMAEEFGAKVRAFAEKLQFYQKIVEINGGRCQICPPFKSCLLYTSDAADDTPCVDLGGRRILQKKKAMDQSHFYRP